MKPDIIKKGPASAKAGAESTWGKSRLGTAIIETDVMEFETNLESDDYETVRNMGLDIKYIEDLFEEEETISEQVNNKTVKESYVDFNILFF